MKYARYPVPRSLQNWIRYFWSYDAHTPEINTLHIRSFADCYPRLIFQDLRSYAPIKDGTGTAMPVCYLSGLDTRPSDAFWESRFSHFGVSFYPHALHTFFRIDATALTNEMPDLLLLDKSPVSHLLLNADSHHERVTVLSKYFQDKLTAMPADPVITHFFNTRQAERLGVAGNLSGIALLYGLSERQLQRKFKTHVGVSASKFIRIQKFEKALALIANARYGELTTLAYELGYSDQAHFINDFKTFTQLAPYAFLKNANLGSESNSFIYSASQL